MCLEHVQDVAHSEYLKLLSVSLMIQTTLFVRNNNDNVHLSCAHQRPERSGNRVGTGGGRNEVV